MGKALGLALAGGGLLALAPSVALADEDSALQERIQRLEKEVEALRGRVDRGGEAGSLADQGEPARMEQEKGSLWTDRNGKPLQKVLDSVWITAYLRGRPTWSTNTTDLEDSVDDEGFQTFFRGGLGVGAKVKNDVSLFIDLDFSGTWGNTSTATVNDTTTTPVLQEAYVDGLYAKHLGQGFNTRVGRFLMEYGDEYVIGNTDFAQTSTYFDGVRISHNVEKRGFSYDAFAIKLVDGFKNPLTPTPDDSAYMFGAYGNWYGFQGKSGMPGGLEPYYIWIWDGRQAPGSPASPTPRDVHTAGFRWYGEKATKDHAGIGWNVNLNGQYNERLLWSTDSRVNYTLSNMRWKPKVFGQFAYAAGDRNGPGYNPLWQDAHGRFGWADQFFFSNLVVWGAGVHATPREGWTAGVELRLIDAARSTAALGTRQIAYEGDLVLKHKYSENVDVEAAFSHVNFRKVKNAGGSPADKVQRAYVQVTVAF